jgi:succinate-semialdehyde dehydrogenase / glutarate-semialdehyde dehydrogenase
LQELGKLAAAIADNGAAIEAALVADTGRLAPSRSEVAAAERLVGQWTPLAAQLLACPPERPTREPFVFAAAQRVPYPLVGVITPWNSPLGLSLIDAFPALIAGCAVIVKPSEIADGFVAPLNVAIAKVPVLADVFRFVTGAGDTGERVIDAVDAVCFTGSVATGRKVAMRAAERLVPAFLELGGKDPAIVLAGCDLDRAAGGIAWSGNYNSGQLCHSIERVYVEAAIHDAFLARLAARVEALTLAFPTPQDGALGPFIDPRQAAIVTHHLDDAVAKGARIVTGGRTRSVGDRIWLEPTVLVDVNHDMVIMREETFGPVLPVMQVADAAEALCLANNSRYGLSASVWGPEPLALELARAINAGSVSVNDASLAAVVMEAEKNSFGVSGLGGSRMGPPALLRFLRTKALMISRITGDSPWW